MYDNRQCCVLVLLEMRGDELCDGRRSSIVDDDIRRGSSRRGSIFEDDIRRGSSRRGSIFDDDIRRGSSRRGSIFDDITKVIRGRTSRNSVDSNCSFASSELYKSSYRYVFSRLDRIRLGICLFRHGRGCGFIRFITMH